MKAIRSVLWALLASLLVGLAVGTALRLRLERPVEYLGSAAPALPRHVGDPRAAVLDARHHEEQVGEPIQDLERRPTEWFLVIEGDGTALRAAAHRPRDVQVRRGLRSSGQDELA